MKITELTTKLFLLSLLSACGSKDKDTATSASSDDLSYTYEDVPPKEYGGKWKRLWNLQGAYISDVVVDVMDNREAGNWTEHARTTQDGVFIQSNPDQETRYRFDGILETPWMPPLNDKIVKGLTSHTTEVTGWRCVVPPKTSFYISHGKLRFRCHEVIIDGDIYGFGNSASARTAGSLIIDANIVKIAGKIHLTGEAGAQGEAGRDGTRGSLRNCISPTNCTEGKDGGAGGNGGSILITARKEFKMSDEKQLQVAGGAGGAGGRGGAKASGRNRCNDGAQGASGAPGVIQLNTPQSRAAEAMQ